MKNFVITLILTSVLFVEYGFAQKFANLDKSPLDVTIARESRNAAPIGKIYYSRPKLDGRELETLAPAGKVWRVGANEATELILNQDMTLAGKKVAKGTYTIFAIPNATSWTIILNSDKDVWGGYSYSEAKDVVRFDVPVKVLTESVENFSIDFNYKDSAIYMAWGKVQVAIPFGVAM
jgi:hypothetical protein